MDSLLIKEFLEGYAYTGDHLDVDSLINELYNSELNFNNCDVESGQRCHSYAFDRDWETL